MNGYTDTAENFDRSMLANATGLFVISRAFGDRMAKSGKGGSIINIGSYMGILGPDYTLYEGTDMCPNGAAQIRCNCIELGGLFNNQNELFVERYNAKCPLGRMANQTDLKGLIVYLAGDASLYMTGAIIPLDGGYSIK